MLVASYLTYSQLYENKIHFQTLIKRLRKLRQSSVLTNISVINTISTYDTFFENSEKNLPKLQKELKDNYLRPSVHSDICNKNFQDRLIFTRLQNLLLAQLSILYCNEESHLLVDGKTEGGFDLGDCCLMASDYLNSPKEERNTKSGSNRKIIKHLGFQLAPIVETLNPLDINFGIVRSEIIYSQILHSQELKQILIKKRLPNFDISTEFENATKISLTEYIDITLAILYFYLFPENELLARARFITIKGFLRQSSLDSDIFKRYLKLESKSVDKFKNQFKKEKRYLKQFKFIEFKKFSLIELVKDAYTCIDLIFLSEKLNSGIYWKIFDSLSSEKREVFSQVYGYIFELYVRRLLQKITSKNSYFVKKGILLSSPEYLNGDEAVDEIIYYPETKHLIFIECKASFMHTEAKYGKSVKKFEAEIKRKFVVKENGDDKGVGQLAKHIGRLFHQDKTKRFHISNSDFDNWIQKAEKVSPILITQEPIIGFHINEELLDNELKKRLEKERIKQSVQISQLTVIDIGTLEWLKPNLENNRFTLEQCVNFRAYRDSKYKNYFPQLISDNFQPTYILDEERNELLNLVWGRITERFFGSL